MRALKCVICALVALSLMSVPAYASLPEVDADMTSSVLDQANVLSSETENQVYLYDSYLERACDGAQLVVVTVNYLDEDSDVAATRLMNDIGVGSADQSNGMLLLLVAKEARGWLAVGDGLDDEFDDDMAGEYLEQYFWDDVDTGDFDGAVLGLTEALYDWYLDYYGVSDVVSSGDSGTPMDDIYDIAPARSTVGSTFIGGVGVILVLVLLIWVLGAASRFTRMRRWGYTGGFFPIFWFGGGNRYRSWYRRQPPPPPGPRPGPGGPAGFGGPGGFMGGGFGNPRPGPRSSRSSSFNRSSGGFRPGGGRTSGGGAGRSSSSFRSGGGFHGGGGHSGGGGAGRR